MDYNDSSNHNNQINQGSRQLIGKNNDSKATAKKIANCLSSLDELIELQTEKIEALKEHKKGLMQQLFPMIN